MKALSVCLIASLAGIAAWAQTPQTSTRSYPLSPAAHNVSDFDQSVRFALSVLAVNADQTANSLAITGTADQLALADWMFPLIDRRPADALQNPIRERKFENSQDSLQVAYLPGQPSARELQEFTIALKVIADNHYVFAVPGTDALVFRGPDLSLEDWLLQTVNSRGPAPSYGEPGSRDQARVFRVRADDPDVLRNMLVELRTTAGIVRCVSLASRHAIAVRGNDREMDLAENIVTRFDTPPAR